MNRRMAGSLAAALIPAVLAWAGAIGPAAAAKLSIYNWVEYIGETTLADFTQASGIATRYDTFDRPERLEQKLLVGGSGYDVAVPPAEPTLAQLIKSQAVQPLDKSKIPNLAQLDDALMDQVATSDPGNRYAVIYQWGTVGIGVLPGRVKALMADAPLDSFDLLFKPDVARRLAPCGITFPVSPIEIIPAVLDYLGLDPNSEKTEDLKAVERTLMAVRPYVKSFATVADLDELSSGETCLVFSYSGDVLRARNRAVVAGSGLEIAYVLPKEGAQLWFDTLVIPADAPNPDAAHAFINFVLQPEVMAGISRFTRFANAVPASRDFLDPALKNNPAIYPSRQAIARMFTVHAVGQRAERARARMWARVQTGN
ncbi:MAG: extracellular solute-binding protein [Azospirillum sp.]|nr:extracellular solute-binding protein [Azospirillum sp.]